MADFTFPNLTTAVSGFSTTAFQPQSTDPYTINPTIDILSSVNLDFIYLNQTRPGWLTGRRPVSGQMFPRGVYNK